MRTGTATVPGVRRRGRPASLTREQVATAALELLDRDGVDGLTMQRLAGALGIGTMTIYGYFRSKDELLDAAVDAAVTAPMRVPRGGGWRADLHALVVAVHRTLVRHPALVQIRLRRPIVRPEALRFGEHGMAILLRAGFEPEQAAHAFRLLFTFVFGHAAINPGRTAAEARAQTATAVQSLPPARFPTLAQHADAFSSAVGGDDQFHYGLGTILDGLEQRLARSG